MDEALERLQPCLGDPFEVAAWLDDMRRRGKIPLFGDDIEMAPAADIVIVARVTPSGKICLETQLRSGWVKEWTKGYPVFSFERERFDRHFPGAPKNRGGRPDEYVVEDLLAEALVYVGIAGALPKTVEGEGGLYDKLKTRLGSRCPERSQFSKIFGPIFRRIKAERSP